MPALYLQPMPVDYIARTRELYDPLPPYRWTDNRGRPVPWTPLAKPVSACRVALVASGGVYVEGQQPFHFKDDTSIRIVPADTEVSRLRVAHFGYPTADAQRDPNCVFPIDRLRELRADGAIADIAPDAVTFMGGIYSQRRVEEELVPQVIDCIARQNVDLCYIVPA
ncbi:MAG TPA: glycine/sarcosine/betaine reductase selenoprotein B family protein [Candidatus Binatia bacterium]